MQAHLALMVFRTTLQHLGRMNAQAIKIARISLCLTHPCT